MYYQEKKKKWRTFKWIYVGKLDRHSSGGLKASKRRKKNNASANLNQGGGGGTTQSRQIRPGNGGNPAGFHFSPERGELQNLQDCEPKGKKKRS